MSDVDIVDVYGWDAVMLEHRVWTKQYWQLWEHLEHRIEEAARHAARVGLLNSLKPS
jgi:hypothetical protein